MNKTYCRKDGDKYRCRAMGRPETGRGCGEFKLADDVCVFYYTRAFGRTNGEGCVSRKAQAEADAEANDENRL